MPINKKTIIQIVVIVVAFGGSGLVLYNGYFKNKADSLAAVQNSQGVMSGDLGNSGVAATGGSSQQILPYGASLDFDKVFKKRILKFSLKLIRFAEGCFTFYKIQHQCYPIFSPIVLTFPSKQDI